MTKEDIVAACRKWYPSFSNDCSGFVRAVTQELGHPIDGNADTIMTNLARSSAWESIDRATAVASAAQGKLVIAGLKSSEHTGMTSHGHVVIVVDGPLYHDTYPLVWGGSIGSAQSRGTKSVGEVWRRSDRDEVRYYRLR